MNPVMVERVAKAIRDDWYPPSHPLAKMAWPGGKDFWLRSARASIEASGLNELREVLRDLLTACGQMPVSTPAPGGCSTSHTFEIEAGTIWAFDAAVMKARAALSRSEGDVG